MKALWARTEGHDFGHAANALPHPVILNGGSKSRAEGTLYFVFAVACFVGLITACKRVQPYAPLRPSNVSANATYIQGPDGHGVWNDCQYIESQDKCQIWTVRGTTLEDGIFIPYDGGNALKQPELKIKQQGGSSVIQLQNGRYLIPASGSGHEAAIRYLDFMTGKTKDFDNKKAGQN